MNTIDELLGQVVHAARLEFGEREYEYRKYYHRWVSGKHGQGGQFYSDIVGQVITAEEYEENYLDGLADQRDAFMCRSNKLGYYSYQKKVVTPGWQDRLIEKIENM